MDLLLQAGGRESEGTRQEFLVGDPHGKRLGGEGCKDGQIAGVRNKRDPDK